MNVIWAFAAVSVIFCGSDVADAKVQNHTLSSTTDCVSSISERQKRIVGGKISTTGSWPWLVKIYRSGPRQKIHSLVGAGVLITDQHVLTSAALVDYLTPKHKLTLGFPYLLDANKNETSLPYETIIIHDNFTANGSVPKNDIAIIKLTKPFAKYSESISPICLPVTDEFKNNDFVGQTVALAGYGVTVPHGTLQNPTLHDGKFEVTDLDSCTEAYRVNGIRLPQHVICAHSNNGSVDACTGDQGSPLMYRKDHAYYVIGLVSFGIGCADPEFPRVYTKVTDFSEWIQNHLD